MRRGKRGEEKRVREGVGVSGEREVGVSGERGWE